MFPSPVSPNIVNALPRDIKFYGETIRASFSFKKIQSPGRFSGEFSYRKLFRNRGFPAVFINTILNIIRLGSKEKMIGINAIRNIAFMKNAFPVWNNANKYLIGKNMGLNIIPDGTQPKSPMAERRKNASCIEPAGFRFVYLLEKAINVFSHLMTVSQVPSFVNPNIAFS